MCVCVCVCVCVFTCSGQVSDLQVGWLTRDIRGHGGVTGSGGRRGMAHHYPEGRLHQLALIGGEDGQ